MKSKIPSFLLERPSSDSLTQGKGGRGLKIPFIEKGIHHVANVIKTGYIQWETAASDSFFHRIDARIKVLFLIFFIIIVSLKKDILPEALIGVFIFSLMVIARLNIVSQYKRIFFISFFFGFLVAVPAGFNVITKGEVIFPIIHLLKSYDLWIYRIPQEIGLTKEGLAGVMMLTLRVMNSLALSFLVLFTTPLPEMIKALKVLKVPDTFIMIITLSYKYMFIFAKTVEDMHLAKKSRLAGQASDKEARQWVAGRIAFMFKKTRKRCEEIFDAMLSRGFSDDIRIYGVRKLLARDWAAGAAFLLCGILFLWM